MNLCIQLPSGQRLSYPASAARLTSTDDSLAVERPACGEVLYASATRAELTVGQGQDARHFQLLLMNARLTPTEWSFLASDVAELPERPDEPGEPAGVAEVVFPMI